MSTRVLSKGSVNGISDVYLPDVGIIDVEYLYTVGPCVPIYILLFNLAMSLVVCFLLWFIYWCLVCLNRDIYIVPVLSNILQPCN